MKNKFDTVYDIFSIITAIILIVSLTVGIKSSTVTPLIGLLNPNNEKTVSTQEYFNLLFSSGSQESNSLTSVDRTVYATNPLDALTNTPEDIKRLIEAAKSGAADDIEDGKIIEKQYGKSTVTTTVGNILVRNNTDTQQKLNLSQFLTAKPDLKINDKSQPSVLIFHTHTTESYEMLDRGWYAQDYVTRSNSADRNMVRVGTEIKKQLEAAGYTVIHDTEIHDTKYTGAYDHSRKSVEKYLKQYPSIKIVLDIHRDAIEENNGTRIKPVATVLGKKAAQMMIITGCEEGKVTAFPNWKKNLTFALNLQSVCEEMYPGLMRPVYFCQRKYNMDLSPNNLLVEMGSCANTLEEAAYSGRLLGSALVKLLNSNQG